MQRTSTLTSCTSILQKCLVGMNCFVALSGDEVSVEQPLQFAVKSSITTVSACFGGSTGKGAFVAD